MWTKGNNEYKVCVTLILTGHVATPDIFNPRKLSTDQWLKTAKSFGARYVVLTLGHFSGFLLWPSKTYNYTVASTTWRQGKADIAAEFIASCKKYSLEYGFFYSVHNNWFMGVNDYAATPPFKQANFDRVAKDQMRELFGERSPYSNPFYIWFDAGVKPGESPDIGPIIRSLAPNSICDECPTFAGDQGVRWVGNENAQAPLPNWYSVPEGMCNKHTAKGTLVLLLRILQIKDRMRIASSIIKLRFLKQSFYLLFHSFSPINKNEFATDIKSTTVNKNINCLKCQFLVVVIEFQVSHS